MNRYFTGTNVQVSDITIPRISYELKLSDFLGALMVR
jgi:hypothetical protein